MASSKYLATGHPVNAVDPSGITLTSFPRELMIEIASSLGPNDLLALIQTSPAFTYLYCVFTFEYTGEHDDLWDQNFTPLQYFVFSGAERAVLHLLELGLDPNAVSSGFPKFQKAPLIHAIRFGRASMVSLLLQHGARVGDRSDTGCWASDHRKIRHRHNNLGFTPLHTALMQARGFYARHFTRRFGVAGDNNSDATELRKIVQLLINAGADVKACTEKSHTPLHIACGKRFADPVVISALINAGADVSCLTLGARDCVYDAGMQPIHYAALGGNTAAMQILLDLHVDVEAKTDHGIRALDLAVLGRHYGNFKMLVDAGAITWAGTVDEPHDSVPSAVHLLGDTITWGELEVWFKLRGWNWRMEAIRSWVGLPLTEDRPRKKWSAVRRDW